MTGTINGLILPLALGSILLGAHKKEVVGPYRHSILLTLTGWGVAAFTLWMGVKALPNIMNIFNG